MSKGNSSSFSNGGLTNDGRVENGLSSKDALPLPTADALSRGFQRVYRAEEKMCRAVQDVVPKSSAELKLTKGDLVEGDCEMKGFLWSLLYVCVDPQ